jgi:hypothetical protein
MGEDALRWRPHSRLELFLLVVRTMSSLEENARATLQEMRAQTSEAIRVAQNLHGSIVPVPRHGLR